MQSNRSSVAKLRRSSTTTRTLVSSRQHSDQQYAVKSLIGCETQKVIYHDSNIGEFPAALRGDARPGQASFDGNYIRTNLAKKAGDRPATAPKLENFIARMQVQRPHQAVTKPAEVVLSRPVANGLR